MKLTAKTTYLLAGALLVLLCQWGAKLMVPTATADHHTHQSNGIKLVAMVDYPLGKKSEYLAWVKSVGDAIRAPEELKRIAAYDNYLGENPHRMVEFEFATMQDATRYLEREEIKTIFDELPNHTSRTDLHIFALRGDYVKQ